MFFLILETALFLINNKPPHEYAVDGKYVVRLVGKKEFCIYDTAVTLPFYYRKVPNVFTPEDSPGLNDTFMIQYGNTKVIPG